MSAHIIQPTEELSRQAAEAIRSLSSIIGSGQQDSYVIRLDKSEQPVTVPGPAMRMLGHLLSELAAGNAVTLTSNASELSLQEAADILDIRGSVLINLIESGQMPHRKVGSKVTLRLADVIEYRRSREVEMRELAALSEEMKQDGPFQY